MLTLRSFSAQGPCTAILITPAEKASTRSRIRARRRRRDYHDNAARPGATAENVVMIEPGATDAVDPRSGDAENNEGGERDE